MTSISHRDICNIITKLESSINSTDDEIEQMWQIKALGVATPGILIVVLICTMRHKGQEVALSHYNLQFYSIYWAATWRNIRSVSSHTKAFLFLVHVSHWSCTLISFVFELIHNLNHTCLL